MCKTPRTFAKATMLVMVRTSLLHKLRWCVLWSKSNGLPRPGARNMLDVIPNLGRESFHSEQWRSQTKYFGGPKCLVLDEQQYFVWDTAYQITKWVDMLNIWGAWPEGLRPVTREIKSFLRGAQFFLIMSNSCKLCPTHFQGGRKYFQDPLAGLLTLKMLAFQQCFLMWLHWVAEARFSEDFDINLLR